MIFTRRRLLAASGAAVALAGVVPGLAFAEPDPATVMQPGQLPDHVLGKSDAPVSLIEYASMTCPHCASFHAEILPRLKTEYLDTGKARYVLREFPLDLAALAAAMLARCAAGDDKRLATPDPVTSESTDRYYGIIDALFARQTAWAMAKNIEENLFNIVKQLGFTEERFKACLSDQKLYEALEKQRERAHKEFEIRGTPSFFVNGKKAPRGTSTYEEIAKLIDGEARD